MKKSFDFLYINKLLTRPLLILTVAFVLFAGRQAVWASPFGQGNFGTNIPFGASTSISIALGSNVSLSLTPSGQNFTASGTSTVTVTSTDVDGYDLYIYSVGSSSLVSGSYTIPASGNVSEAPLVANTWGYNTDATTNYIGLTTTPALLVSTTGPYETGNTTTITFGVLASIITGEGSYSGNVTYTAVALNN